ncbi:hypothetical protein KY386_02890 [Candidatus Parcubacteria bacterium]|nr:hypothetical protein [Candidatus Parcubacteria bacterium]
MTVYYVVFAVIVVLAGINFGTLWWVTRLQRRLHEAKTASAAVPATSPSAVQREAHSVLLAEELIKLEQSSQGGFKSALDRATQDLGRQLGETSGKINHQLETLSSQVITEQLGEYQKTLVEMRQTAIASVGQIQAAIEEQRARLEKDVNEELEAQKQRLVTKLDQKLGEVVSAYLVEALGSQIDLGAQSQYLFKTLEEHKEELKKEVVSGV